LTGNPALTGTATPRGISDYSGQINRGQDPAQGEVRVDEMIPWRQP
jgi:hypothetical protein